MHPGLLVLSGFILGTAGVKAAAEALKDLRDAEKHSDEVVIESTAVTENESTETVVKETVVVKND